MLRNLRPLEHEGLITQGIPPAARRVEVSLTSKGRRKLAEIYPHWKRAQESTRKTLGANRRDTILTDLETAAEKLG